MTARRWLRAAVCVAAGTSWLLPAQADSSGGIAADLRAGRPFVVAVVDSGNRALLASEAYADWQSYHADFIARGRGALPVYTLRPAAARAQLPRLPRSLRNGTVFVAGNGRALLYDGLVLEPDVYAVGRAHAEGGSADNSTGFRAIDLAPARGRAGPAR